MGDDANLLSRRSAFDDRVDRKDFDVRDSRRIDVQVAAVSDPATQDRVVRIALCHHRAALMRCDSQRLSQHQRFFGGRWIDPPCCQVIGQGTKIVRRDRTRAVIA